MRGCGKKGDFKERLGNSLDPSVLVALVQLPGREVLQFRVLDAVEVFFTVGTLVEDNH